MGRVVDNGLAEQPLRGVVLCFTSFAPEQRTRYADFATQMGAEHKLDLTSETSHLIVGNTDTLKYKYVAKEREDIKVLRPEWVEAVRELWINVQPIDFEKLAIEYRMPTMAGLKICITGFDDLNFRAQLQKNIIENGGEYTGDLTKDVTHLIALKPEGKKYEYGKEWGKKVVSLQWYKDTLERGMQLDEALYSVTAPPEKQGVGAWVRSARRSSQTNKRMRNQDSAPERVKKVRRTASARQGSQAQSFWSEIVAGTGFDTSQEERQSLKMAKSLPETEKAEQDPAANTENEAQSSTNKVMTKISDSTKGFFSERQFIIRAFDDRKLGLLRKIILENGGTIAKDYDDSLSKPTRPMTLLFVPFDVNKSSAIEKLPYPSGLLVVTELWLEHCMLRKTFVPPQDYPLGQLIRIPSNDFSRVCINATGFSPLETLHISKIVGVLGAMYSQVFSTKVSVLVSKSVNVNQQKVDLAQHSGIPIVTQDWLWSTIKTGSKAPFENYLIQRSSMQTSETKRPQPQERSDPIFKEPIPEVSTMPLPPEQRMKRRLGDMGRKNRPYDMQRFDERDNLGPDLRQNNTLYNEPARSTLQEPNDTSADWEHVGNSDKDCDISKESFDDCDAPLREISPNSPGKTHPASNSMKPSATAFDGLPRIRSHAQNNAQPLFPRADRAAKPSFDPNAMNQAVRELLDQGRRDKGHGNEPPKKGRLIGRALSNLSNLSNSSATNHGRQSRASSIESINTDGIGSDIAASNITAASVPRETSHGFTGRARTALAVHHAHDLDHDLAGRSPREATPPQMTQLAYEEPEEAVALREKLAEQRRQRGRLGQKQDDPRPERRPSGRQDRRIKDDDVLGNAGWGAGTVEGRTRRKKDTVGGITEF